LYPIRIIIVKIEVAGCSHGFGPTRRNHRKLLYTMQ
jgi:hypothetical protein